MNESIETILQRIVDRRASTTDWDELSELSAVDPLVIGTLVERLREDDMLRQAFEPVGNAASEIALPTFTTPRLASRWSFASGFAAALLIGLITWALSSVTSQATPASTLVSASPEALIQQYIESGRARGTVVEELPRVPLGVHRVDDDTNRLQVVFVRRFLERGEVETTMQVASNEHGDAVTRPVTNIASAFSRDI